VWRNSRVDALRALALHSSSVQRREGAHPRPGRRMAGRAPSERRPRQCGAGPPQSANRVEGKASADLVRSWVTRCSVPPPAARPEPPLHFGVTQRATSGVSGKIGPPAPQACSQDRRPTRWLAARRSTGRPQSGSAAAAHGPIARGSSRAAEVVLRQPSVAGRPGRLRSRVQLQRGGRSPGNQQAAKSAASRDLSLLPCRAAAGGLRRREASECGWATA